MNEPDFTPEIEDVIRMAIEQRLFNLNVSLPGQVESFDPATQTASIQPSIQRRYDDQLINLPVIQKVPVVFPRAGNWSISGPVNPGDNGQLIFCQRSIDVWKKTGGIVDPNDTRKFHITDAVFYPGLNPNTKAIPTISPTNLRIQNGSTRFELQDGKMRLENVAGDELLNLLTMITAQLATVAGTLSTATINPQTLMIVQAAQFASAQSAITALNSRLAVLKG